MFILSGYQLNIPSICKCIQSLEAMHRRQHKQTEQLRSDVLIANWIEVVWTDCEKYLHIVAGVSAWYQYTTVVEAT